MNPDGVERKLAAILSADVVGYSRLMAEDEAGTVQRLTAYREEIGLLVRQHRGRVVDTAGDNLLAEFPTATDAVECAVELQAVLRVRNGMLPEVRRMKFRIGVHLGEIRVEAERVYGAGVNIAARLEGLADPGGICISAEVRSQVHSHLKSDLEDLGEQSVKNIAEPIRVYRIRPTGAVVPPMLRSRTRRSAALLALALLVCVLGALVVARYLGGTSRGTGGAESPSFSGRRLSISLPDSAPLSFVGSAPLGVGRTALDLSPDGRLLVYAGETSSGGTQLYLRPLDRFEVRALPGTQGAYSPFFSLDSRSVGFFADDQLKKVSVLGGNPVALADATNSYGGAWWTDDRILFATHEGARLFWVPAAGGAPRELEMRSEGSPPSLLIFSRPAVLPNGRHLLFNNLWNDIFAYSFESGVAVPILQGGTSPRYIAEGQLVFARGSDLMAVAFDPDQLAIRSEPVLVAAGVRVEGFRQAQFSVAGGGLVAYAPGANAMEGSLSIVDRDGRAQTLPFPAGIFSPPTFSPSGDSLAVGILEATWDIWIFDLEQGTRRRLTRDGNNQAPVWSADGEQIFFMSDRGAAGTYDIYSIPVRGAQQPAAVIEDPWDLFFPSVSRDGTLLVMKGSEGAPDLYLLPPDQGAEPVLVAFAAEPGVSEGLARISADGKWVAYTGDETGRYEVYVTPTDGQGKRVQISIEGGEEPAWSPSGDRIFFRSGTTTQLMAVPIDVEGSSIRAGSPAPVFDEPAWVNLIGHSYDVAPDGSGFLIVRSEQKQSTTEIRVVGQGSHW